MPANKSNVSKQGQNKDSNKDEIRENMYARKVICDRLARFERYLNSNDIDIFELESRLKSVEDDFQEFDRIQTRLEFLDRNEDVNRLETESEFYSLISNAKRYISYKNAKPSLSVVNNQNDSIENRRFGGVAKLPELGLPSFVGKYEAWYSFWDIFSSVVHNRSDLNEIDKFLYLKICCKDDALRLIDSLDVTANNYSIAIELLQKRYENKRAIVNYHINNMLFNLPHVSRESPIHIRKLLDETHQHISALKKLSLPVEHWDMLLIAVILQKLDDKTKKDWETRQNDKELPKLIDLTEFLAKKCFTLEAINFDFSKNFNKNSNFPNDKNIYKPQARDINNTRRVSFAVTDSNNVENDLCLVCKQQKHYIFQCPKFLNLPISDKYQEIRKQKLCGNCLRPGHFKINCNSSGCKKCHLKHNTSLHVDDHRNQPRSNGNDGNSYSRNRDRQNVVSMSYAAAPVGIEQNVAPGAESSSRDRETENRQVSQHVLQTPTYENYVTVERAPTMCGGEREPNTRIIGQSNHENRENSDSLHTNVLTTYSNTTREENIVMLSTANILIKDSHDKWISCNALLDSGSQSNLISERLCRKLEINCEKTNIPLSGISQMETKIKNKTRAIIKSRIGNFETELSFLVLKVITENIPIVSFDKSLTKYPQTIQLADENFNLSKEIDILLGAEIFYELLENEKIYLGENLPVLQLTRLGWIFTGCLKICNNPKKTICNFSRISNKNLHDSLIRFWQIEHSEEVKMLDKNEKFCEQYFLDTTTRNEDNKFIVKYPFDPNFNGQLGASKTNAISRFKNLEKRLDRDEQLKNQYVSFMREYIELGHMTMKCNLDEDVSIPNKSFFLPHTAVLRDSITTKCRVVFDASARSNTGISFNDMILAGPTIQPDLFSILLRLRLRKFVLSADVKMMYRCILIDKKERDFQQIIWRENSVEKLKVYNLNTVTYGTSSAPFQATRCLKQLAIDFKEKYPRTSEILETSFYMDDLLVSLNSEKEAIEIYNELTEILESAQFYLRKWSTNCENILNYIEENKTTNDDNFVLYQGHKELKTLGIIWNANTDELKYSINNVKVNTKSVTKRTVLSTIAQIFDPLGLIGPAIIKAKLLIQKLWCLKLGWDDDIPGKLKEEWLEFVSQIQCLNEIKIDRHVLSSKAKRIKLFGFGDASEKAYGCCVYIASFDGERECIRLLTAKSRVAPLKNETLPRLELLAAVLLAELIARIKNILNVPIEEIIYFTDSKIVLSWLRMEPARLKTFVANRIVKIIELTDLEKWRHVNGTENPADIISRGLNPKDLVDNRIWYHGPNFLYNENLKIIEPVEMLEFSEIPEIKPNNIVLANTQSETEKFDILNRYSCFNKLRKVVAYMIRFKNRTLKKIVVETPGLTVEELDEALLFLIKLAQFESFKPEIEDLKKNKRLSKNSKILNLNPFLDSNNVLRVGGRLSKSSFSFDQRHPIILPYDQKFTELVVLNQHVKHLHAGVQTLLSIIRLTYWPIKGKNIIKRVLKYCMICNRVNPKPFNFLMGDLPADRVKPSYRAFTTVGIDYGGPICVKENSLRKSRIVKTYFCVFVCFLTRAVHIELAVDLSTNSFLNVLKRFCSRRGKPVRLYSDNGLNFVGACNQFKELYTKIHDNERNKQVKEFLAVDKIHWSFIPARSPHMGGIWEAAIKSTKFHLRRMIANVNFTYDEITTLFAQIEAVLNSRPLTPISTDVNDYLPLTPSHFLIGDSLMTVPEEDLRHIKENRLTRYQKLSQVMQQFWARWSLEYLSNLQTRTKWKEDGSLKIEIGSLVVLIEENVPPLKWPMARIVQLHPGHDGVVRVVSVKLSNGTVTKRTIAKICLLPINDEIKSSV